MWGFLLPGAILVMGHSEIDHLQQYCLRGITNSMANFCAVLGCSYTILGQQEGQSRMGILDMTQQ